MNKNRQTTLRLVALVALVGVISYLLFVRGPMQANHKLQTPTTQQAQSVVADSASAQTAVKAFAAPPQGIEAAIKRLSSNQVELTMLVASDKGTVLTGEVTGSFASVTTFFATLESQIYLSNNQLRGNGPLYSITSLQINGTTNQVSAQFELTIGS
jgi:hypothetical protein